MPNASAHTLVIAHQLGEDFARVLPDPPPGVSWRRLRPEAAWEVPEEASALILVPPRVAAVVAPAQAPAGWPHNLKWIHSFSAGVDEYPKWVFDAPVVTCGRGANSVSVAEFVLAGMLAMEKKIPDIWISTVGDWQSRGALGTLQGKTLGLVGYGSIGQAVAVRALPFGMDVLAARRTASSGATPQGVRFAHLHTVLAEADHLVIAAPLTSDTLGLIGQEALSRIKPGLHLMNVSRGRLLDQDALVEALDTGRVGFATLDVADPEPLPAGHRLYTHARVHLSPHLSGSAASGRIKAAALFRENLQRFLAGEPLQGVVRPDLGY